MARFKIPYEPRLVSSAALMPSYLTYYATRANEDTPPMAYDEFERGVFDCEFDDRGGGTPETAIVIYGAASHFVGVAAEYIFLCYRFGEPRKDWTRGIQSVGNWDGRKMDVILVTFPDRPPIRRYFDITEFYHKP